MRGSEISLVRQCDLLGVKRSTLYRKRVGMDREPVELMTAIDEIYTAHPIKGFPSRLGAIITPILPQ